MADFMTYRTAHCGPMRAKILTRHRDGDVTVEPFFFQEDGNDTGSFQGGYKVRVPRSHFIDASAA
ncbi:MAG TPA: hypothetical protein VGV37_06525 [Aliidongia sp.]|uniref:hypothetical protein n=1 Tax=Aliidongia sp. TaxID=1914230 RepID=UPI002DDCA3B9|nr:hypothetical protein [Aliidongia sp.]HEV2674181.1 hypothetical protein [Aliidongia sp.]